MVVRKVQGHTTALQTYTSDCEVARLHLDDGIYIEEGSNIIVVQQLL